MTNQKIKIGNILTQKSGVIEIDDKTECFLSGETWYNNTTFATICKKGCSPKKNDDVDWGSMKEDVKITAMGGSYTNEMFDCILEIIN